MSTAYEKCPRHKQNDVLLFCVGGDCIEPLCKACCKEHVTWHNSCNSLAELDTVDNLKQNCLKELRDLKIKFEE